jgi:hypothetical protein
LKTSSVHSYKNCSLPFSSSKTAHHHTGAWLWVPPLITIS